MSDTGCRDRKQPYKTWLKARGHNRQAEKVERELGVRQLGDEGRLKLGPACSTDLERRYGLGGQEGRESRSCLIIVWQRPKEAEGSSSDSSTSREESGHSSTAVARWPYYLYLTIGLTISFMGEKATLKFLLLPSMWREARNWCL